MYDAEEGVYKFWGCTALSDGTNATYLSYTNKYLEALNSFNKSVDMSSVSAVDGVNTVYLNAVDEVVGSQSDGSNSTTLYAGKIKDAAGNVLTTHIGLQNGLSTWSDLSGVKNNQNWYNYGNGYVAQSNADLYFTENLLFSSSAAKNAVVLNATVDLGVGYAEFSASGSSPVSYTVSSASGGNYMLNSAGYLVNENVSLHLQLTSSDKHMYEWRKIGAGDLYIEGSGDNNILLNLGGSGTTYLKRTDGGYAAYNVQVNNGAKVVIDDIGQIERDFTFGNKGGVLDMNGQSMDWYTTSTSESIADAGFTINALTEDAVIANNKGSSTLVYRQSGETTFLGSFRDSSDSSLKIQYAGGGTWVLNSVHTNLQNDNSGLQVDNGKVVLRGTNTIHAEGSANGVNSNRYSNADDWHYADAAMDVPVKNGATFELGSHARLTGDVTVESGGTYVMREGVKLSQEYVEGGQSLEDTSKYAAYYGHKGGTVLNGGTLQVEYSAGVTANNTYAGNISGSGNMSVDLKDWSAIFTLSGDNSFTGTKILVCGGLIADSSTALGDTSLNKWVIQEDAWIASHKENGAQLLEHIDTSSTGTLVLSADSEQLNIAGYNDLFIGAEAGKTVQYGTLGTTQTLNAADGAWRLGGGGGTLVVNYVLSGANDLLLGATENSTGVVHLTNQGNSFTGNIIFSGEGVLLTYEEGALGSAVVDLSYGNASDLFFASDVMRMSTGSDGMVLVDNFSDNAISLQNHPSLTVGVAEDKTWSGELWLAENQAYRFGAINGATFTVTAALESGRDLIVDAQGSSGGKVVLDSSAITGQISIMGRNDGSGGDITLVIAQDDALSAASGVSVLNGGILDLGGTSHVLHNVEVQSGGQIKGTSASNLIFNITEDSTVAGRLQLGTVEKTGAADLALSGDAGSSWSLLTISEGSVTVGSGTLGSNIALAGGVLAAGSGAVIHYNGVISIAEGATECIRGGAWKFSGAENIVNNGTLNLQNTKLYFSSTSAQEVRGTLTVTGSSELHSIETNGADYMQKQLEHLNVTAGNELKIVDHTWNTIWHIDKLSGDGTFKWNPRNTHYYSSCVIIDGDGRFGGNIDFYRQHDPGYVSPGTYDNYQAYLQIDSEDAISGATVNLTGTWAQWAGRDAYATLALNDERIKIGGLKATGYALAHVMAGAAPNAVSKTAVNSSRCATLEITGSGNYEYKGSIGTEADKTSSYGVSIEMSGTGTQLFNGSTVVVNDVAALNGTLNFNSAGLYIKGDVTVAQGASLKLNASYTLGSGHTLNVVAGDNGGAAVLNSGLVFDGGTLHFDVLSSSHVTLAVNGSISASEAGGMKLTFADTDALQLGVKYLLASGDWSAMENRISLFTPELYKQMTLEAAASGLSIQLDMKEGFSYWGGNNSELQTGNNLVFMGGEGNLGRIEITAGAQVDTAVFDNEADFTISSTDGSTLAFGTMGKYETGALVVNTNVTADTLLVEDKSALRGTGKLAVGEINGTGTLQVSDGAHLQVEAGEGATLQLLDGSKLTTTGTALGCDLILGEDAVTSRVTLDIQGESLSLNGEVSALGDTTMAVQGTGVLNYNAALNNLAELQLSETTGLNVATTLTTKVAQNGATVTVQDGGVWQVAADNGALNGDVVVNAGGQLTGADLVTENTMTVAGNVSYDSLIVQNGGKLVMQNGGALDASRAATIANGGTLELNGVSFTSKAEVTNGGVVNAQGATITSGAEIIATSGTGTLSAGTGTLTVNGLIGASEGATLRLEGSEVRIYSANINTGGGVLELAGNTYLGYLTAYATQNIGGTLNVVQNSTLHTEQGDPSRYQNITHNINHLHISNGKKLTITDSTNDWNHIYNISLLTGEGEIEWVGVNRWFDNTPSGPSRLVLSGDNSFKGTLLVNQWDNHGSMQHVSLAHDYAAKDMVINLWGDSNSRPGLAISTQNAHVAGIGGTTNTFVYAGEIRSYGNGSNPTSTALNTLTINTAGKDYTYNGTILGDASYGLHLVKDGAGKQTFANSANAVHDVTVLQGNLEFTTAPTVHGDVSIAQGAELTLGSGSYSLNAGQTLNVLAGAGGMPAVLNNSLVLNGGSLKFSAYDSTAAVLSTQGVSLGSDFTTLNVLFGNTMSIREGSSYLLASGDWSAVAGKLTCDAGEYLLATLGATSSGLQVTFALADGYSVWRGDESVLQAGSKVLFGCLGGSNDVALSASASIGTAYFDNLGDVTVSSANGSSLSANTIEKHGAGALVLDTAVNADSVRVIDSSTITGNGSLSTTTLTAEDDMTTGLSVQAANIQGNGHIWTLDGSEKQFTQTATVSQINSFSQLCVTGQAELKLSTGATLNTAITGDGTLSQAGEGTLTSTAKVQIGIFNVNSGNFEAQGDVEIGCLRVADGSEVTMCNSAATSGAGKTLGTVELGTGAILQTNDRAAVKAATSVGDLKLTGSAATLRDQYHSGYYNIGSLSLGEGVASATLDIVKKADSTYATVVNLGDADSSVSNFRGSIALSSLTGQANDSKRSLFLVLGDSLAAAGASINMKAADSNTAILGLGINTASATIAGLESASTLSNRAKVFSGSIGTTTQWGSDSSVPGTVGTVQRTLVIDTASGGDYTFYGEVMGNLNLVKKGAGVQSLAGSSANFNGSILVENGTLALGSSALGMLETATSVMVDGGRLDLSAAGSSANLSRVSGAGTVVLNYDMNGNGSGFDFSGLTGEVELRKGRIELNASTFGADCPDFRLTASNSQLVFNGNGTVVNSNVHISANTTDFHVNSGKSGTIGGDITGNSLVKRGDGSLTVGGNMKLNGMLSTHAGVVILTGEDNSIATVDGAMDNGNTAVGTLRLAQDARLEVTDNIWGRSNTGIYLESGAELNISGQKLSISNRAEEGTASLAATTSTGPGEYNINRTNYQISNAHVTYTGGDATINNRLTNSAIENAGNGTLKVNNADNTLSGVYATGGSIKLFSADELDLKALEVAASLSVSAYCDVRESVDEEARISVREIATFGTGVTLNADLVMKSGATLKIADTVQMGSDVRLESGLQLAGAQYDTLSSLRVGEKVTLFSGVDSLFLGNSTVASETITLDDRVLASEYFNNLSDIYFLVYDTMAGVGQGELSIAVIPEPTTVTLSLMALAGLAARRRRK